jgi:hypothetical protein
VRRAALAPPPSSPRARSALILGFALLPAAALAGCEAAPLRLRFVSSRPAAASWAFAIDDRGQGAELLVDDRPRQVGCRRAGREQRCELRGLFPGGHTVEARVAGAYLKRSVVIGRPWPQRPLLVRARTVDDVSAAVTAGADGVVVRVSEALAELYDLADAAHRRGARIVIEGGDPEQAIERAGADAVLDAELPADLARRFPDARALRVDAAASRRLAALAEGGPLDGARDLASATGLVETPRGIVAAALALLAPSGAILAEPPAAMLPPRRSHAALRDGAARITTVEGRRLAFTLSTAKDSVLVAVNGDAAAPWTFATGIAKPLDLLGSTATGPELVIRPGDAAMIVPMPASDKQRF